MYFFWYRDTTHFIDFAERQKLEDAERGVKSSVGEGVLLRRRMGWLFAAIFALPLVLILEYFFSFSMSNSLAIAFFRPVLWFGFYILQIATRYIASVDIPPFAKSRAWELFKELFAVRELIPIRVRPPS